MSHQFIVGVFLCQLCNGFQCIYLLLAASRGLGEREKHQNDGYR